MGETDQTLVYEKQDGAAALAAPRPKPATGAVASAKPNYSGTGSSTSVRATSARPRPRHAHPEDRPQGSALKVANDEEDPWASKLGAQPGRRRPRGHQQDGDRDVKNAVAWEAGNIVVTTKLQYEGSDVVIKATYVLSGDGKS